MLVSQPVTILAPYVLFGIVLQRSGEIIFHYRNIRKSKTIARTFHYLWPDLGTLYIVWDCCLAPRQDNLPCQEYVGIKDIYDASNRKRIQVILVKKMTNYLAWQITSMLVIGREFRVSFFVISLTLTTENQCLSPYKHIYSLDQFTILDLF